MEPRGISFADVLKNRPKSSFAPQQRSTPKLMDLFLRFQRNPAADYTLSLGQNPTNKHNYPNIPCRNGAGSRSNVFDSWIQQQFGNASNKQNAGFVPNKKGNASMMAPLDLNQFGKGKEPPKVPTNIMANLKKQHSSSMLLLNQVRNKEENSTNSNKDPTYDTSDPSSSKVTNKHNEISQKYPQNHINPPFPQSSHSQHSTLKTQFQKITSQKSLQITNLLTKDPHASLEATPTPATPSLAQLIASTQNIHLQIANMAKKIAEERKISLEEPLLISDRQQSENRRWEDAKNMVNGYFDKFQKEKSYAEPMPKSIPSANNPARPSQQPSPSHSPSSSPLLVGYSFSVTSDPPHSSQGQGQLRQNQMIEQISEIQSEQASQRISDSGNFDFVRAGFGTGRAKGEGGIFSRQRVENLVGDLKMEFDGMRFEDCRDRP